MQIIIIILIIIWALFSVYHLLKNISVKLTLIRFKRHIFNIEKIIRNNNNPLIYKSLFYIVWTIKFLMIGMLTYFSIIGVLNFM